jgi:hypothetical protein
LILIAEVLARGRIDVPSLATGDAQKPAKRQQNSQRVGWAASLTAVTGVIAGDDGRVDIGSWEALTVACSATSAPG